MPVREEFEELARRHLAPAATAADEARNARDVVDAADSASKMATRARYRALLKMQAEGMSLARIADELGVARGTAQTLVSRAKAAMESEKS